MDLAASPGQPKFRWLVTPHWELDGFGLPRRFPWPSSAEARINPHRPFPFELLRQGIHSLIEQNPPGVELAIWKNFLGIYAVLPRFHEALDNSDFPQVRAILQEIEQVHPCPFIHFHRAFMCEQEDDIPGAIQCYQKIVAASPNLASAWTPLGHLFLQTGQNQQATNCFWRAMESSPAETALQEALVRLKVLVNLRKEPRDPDSVSYIQPRVFRAAVMTRCKELLPNPAQLHEYLAYILDLSAAFGVPLDAVEWCAQQMPDSQAMQLCYGKALRLDKRWARAMQVLRDCIRKFPADGKPYYELAEVSLQQSREKEAAGLLDKALAIDPNLIPALLRRFAVNVPAGSPNLEDQLLEFASKRQSWAAYLIASRVAENAGKRDSALTHASQAWIMQPEDEAVLLHFGRLLYASGNDAKVVEALKPPVQSLKYDPELTWLYSLALKRLHRANDACAVLQSRIARPLPSAWLDRFQTQVNILQGFVVESPSLVERYASGRLKRSLLVKLEGVEPQVIFSASRTIPATQSLSLRLSNVAKPIASVSFHQGLPGGRNQPVDLGCVKFSLPAGAPLESSEIDMTVEVTTDGMLRVRAFQGKRKFHAEWHAAHPATPISASAQTGTVAI